MNMRIPFITLVMLGACVFAFAMGAVLPSACAEPTPETLPEGNQEEKEDAAEPTDAIIEYSHDPNTVVIQMEWTDGRIRRLPESPPQLRIYADGLVTAMDVQCMVNAVLDL